MVQRLLAPDARSRCTRPDRSSCRMPAALELSAAFDAALRQVERALAADMRTMTGEPARTKLEQLGADLRAQRASAVASGSADPAWVRETVRRVADWAPATELALIAALGQIARANGRGRPA